MASFTDWLARTFFISAKDEQVAADVAAHQQSLLDQQLADGKVGAVKYYQMSNEIADTGATFYDEQLGKSGTAGLPGLAFHYWWIWPAVGAVPLVYFWPVLRPFVSRFPKRSSTGIL